MEYFRQALGMVKEGDKPQKMKLLSEMGTTILKAEAEHQFGKFWKECEEILREAHEMGSKDARANLGVALRSQGRLDEAQELLEDAIKNGDPYSHTRFTLGQVYQQLNQTDKAVEMFEEVMEMDPKDIDAKSLRKIYEQNFRLN